MTEEQKKEYSLRISQSNKTEIVVISYEIILNYIQSAREAYMAGETEEMVKNLKNAKLFINDLSSSLDLKYDISYNLMNIYRFANKTIFDCIIKNTIEGIEAVERIINSLMESFSKVAKEDMRGLAIKGANKVYAGLTYSNNSRLDEVCYSFDKTGFLG